MHVRHPISGIPLLDILMMPYPTAKDLRLRGRMEIMRAGSYMGITRGARPRMVRLERRRAHKGRVLDIGHRDYLYR